MAGKLDEISVSIGALRAMVADMRRDLDEVKRHTAQICRNGCPPLSKASVEIARHADVIEAMRPTLLALEAARAKLAIWASIGFASVVLLGWIVEAGVKYLVAWTLSHFQ